MNLTNCKKCGAVFNKNVIKFPEDDFENEYDNNYFYYNGEKFIAKVNCPVCLEGFILEEEGQW